MKRTLTIGLTIAAIHFAGPRVSLGQLNGSFESGNFSGWQVDIARGNTPMQPRQRPAGTAEVLAIWRPFPDSETFQLAADGKRFAALGSLASGNFVGQRTYQLSLNQSLTLAAGDVITGWASFYNGDYEAQDSAWVKVWGHECELLATPWRENSGSQPLQHFNATPYRTVTPWTQWFWQAPADGTYTVSLGVTTQGDNNFASYGFFDGIWKTPVALPIAAVPEPSTLALLASAAGLGLLRSKRLSRS